MTTRTEDEWIECFGEPRTHSGGSTFFETFGDELATVEAADPLTL